MLPDPQIEWIAPSWMVVGFAVVIVGAYLAFVVWTRDRKQ